MKKILSPILFFPIWLLQFLYGTAAYSWLLNKILFLLYLFKVRRHVVEVNLSIALPNIDSDKKLKIIKKTYQHPGQILSFWISCKKQPWVSLKEKFIITNLDLLQDSIKKFGSVIVVTGHYGLWEAPIMLPNFNIPMAFLADRIHNQYFQSFVHSARTKFDAKMIYKNSSLGLNFVKLIKQNYSLGFVADLNFNDSEVVANFFSRPSNFGVGPYRLALAFKRPIFYFDGHFNADKYNLNFKPIELNFPDKLSNNEKNIYIITLLNKFIFFLEESIQNNPEEYFWFNRRWKKPVAGTVNPY